MNYLEISSKNKYNNISLRSYAEHSHLVKVVRNAKRYKKFNHFRRRQPPNKFWWNVSNSSVLQKTEFEMDITEPNQMFSCLQTISSGRFDFSHNYCNYSRYQSFQQNKSAAMQWFFPANNWHQWISICEHSAKIYETLRFKDRSRNQQDSRSIALENVLSSASPDKYPFRLRFNSSNSLWKTNRRSKSRIQSWQERETLLSPISLLRILQQRLLARSFTTRGRIHCCRRSGISERMFSESSTPYLPDQTTGRLGFFRSQIHRAFRRKKRRLCNRGETNRRYKEKTFGLAIPPVQERLVGCRIPLYANEVETTSSLRCDSQETSGQTTRPANFVYSGTLFLSDIRYKHSFGSSQHLVFLQGPRFHRNSYQRAQTRLLFNQDSNEQFPGKPGLFFFTSSGLQHNQLVQTSMFAGKPTKCNVGHYSHEPFTSSRGIGELPASKCIENPRCLYFQTPSGLRNSKNRKVKDQLNLTGLLNFQNSVPSIHCKN